MGKRFLDPSKAIVDIDVTGLTYFSLVPHGMGAMPGAWEISLTLAGGLGRIPGPDGIPVITDKVNHMQISGIYVDLESEHAVMLKGVLERWMVSNMPLRFLDFGEEALLMEDGDNYVTLPPGTRNVNVNVDSAWLNIHEMLGEANATDPDED